MILGVLIYSLAGGGAERFVSYMASYCLENNIEVHLILMNETIAYELPNNLNIHHIEKSSSTELGIIKAVKIPILALKYAKLIKKLKITHSLSFLTRPAFINVLAGKFNNNNIKVIVNERAFPSLQYNYKGFQSIFNKILIKALYKKSDLVISNANGNATDLIKNFGVPSEKVLVVHNPIDLKKINKIKPLSSFYNKDKFNLITIGRLDYGKNHRLLIEAMGKLDNLDIILYIFGDGILKNELDNLISDLDLTERVIMMGFDSNPYQYLKAADLFVFGSNHEGFPNVILEAMACNLPVLSTNCQSGPCEIMKLRSPKNDIMITDYGILVPISNVELMKQGILYFYNNRDFLDHCKTNVPNRVNDFAKEPILKKYFSLITECI
jgi:N-acetylgalactosamine-N,N'-diacetylbacillosaminyl-diphospho-undecaprenol 4-alpha-N-acetylgalactosaminyltransferase